MKLIALLLIKLIQDFKKMQLLHLKGFGWSWLTVPKI